ncbi:glutathione S-transferase family protein [Sorangium sp. So ce1153]|uniref:glutathione S-transferase family protein n=1 Tax=Sorangium sp. So ce1153 TaxID=3133333 RepID=UPI003F618F81
MKLIYFPVRGRMEPARLMLELVGARYELETIPFELWSGPEGKERMLRCTPFGQLPVLQDGEFVLSQSQAINRYVARKLNLYGDTAEESARIDEISETANEILHDIGLVCWNPLFHEIRAEHRVLTSRKLELLEKHFLRTSADPEHWVLPGRYTLADATMAFALESIWPLQPGLLEDFPKLRHAMTAFFAADGVRGYVRGDRRFRTWTTPGAAYGGKPEETHHWAAD